MSLANAVRGLARSALQAKQALPVRGGAGAPVKTAPLPDKPVSAYLCLPTLALNFGVMMCVFGVGLLARAPMHQL